MNKHTDYQDRVARIVERDNITSKNLTALFQAAPVAPVAENVHAWLVKAALRRHRKATAEGGAHFNNGLTLAIKGIKARVAR